MHHGADVRLCESHTHAASAPRLAPEGVTNSLAPPLQFGSISKMGTGVLNSLAREDGGSGAVVNTGPFRCLRG